MNQALRTSLLHNAKADVWHNKLTAITYGYQEACTWTSFANIAVQGSI